jgi:glycosyltransferase involved in cell wall biosynthesis
MSPDQSVRSSPHILQVTPTTCGREGVVGGGARITLYVDQAIRRAAAETGIALSTTLLALDAAACPGSSLGRHQAIPGHPWDPRSVGAHDLIARIRQADAVYVHQCLTEIGLFAAAHARLLRKRVYGSDAGGGVAALLAANPDAASVYDAVHAQSAFGASTFVGLPVIVHLVPGPIDTDAFRPPVDPTVRDPKAVLSVGRLLPHKGYERTIRALPSGCSFDIVGRSYDADYVAFLRSCAAGKDVRFRTDLGDAEVKELLDRAGVFVHASTHFDHLGRFYHKPALLGLAPLEALSNGLTTLVSHAGSLPELAALPGCHVFRSDAELSELLTSAVEARLPRVPPKAMHKAVVDGYGLLRAGIGLLQMMEVLSPCGS